jgi:hypothetical protein
MLGPPSGYDTWSDAMTPSQEPTPSEWNGNLVLLYEIRDEGDNGSNSIDLYITEDDTRVLRFHAEQSDTGVGDTVVDYTTVEVGKVPADSVSFSKSGLTAISQGIAEPGLDDCPVTVPSQAFVPPDTHPPTPSDPDMVWFGKDELWTAVSADGISEERKSVWWSSEFTDPGIESSPEITVSYTLLNSPTALTIVNDEGTNASTPEDGLFIIAGSEPDVAGCWQVTAIYKDAGLSYIYYNPEGQDPATATPTAVVPEVVGMTVDNARRAITGKGFKPFFVDSDAAIYEVCAQDPADGSVVDIGGAVEMRTAPLGGCDDLMGLTDPNSCERAPAFTEERAVYFNCGDGTDPERRTVQREFRTDLPVEGAVAEVFAEMLKGPTVAEREAGYTSFFSEETADALIAVTYQYDTQDLVIDFTEAILINNASTPTGTQLFLLLGELLDNAFQFDEVRSVEFQVNGSCEAFWAFLQAGDDVCNVLDKP